MKKTQIDKAIESLEAKIAVLQMAVTELKQQQKAKPARRVTPVVTLRTANE